MAEKKEKELKATKQEESLADSKKIDLYINNQDDQEQGISIMNVFSRLKARFHFYIWVILIGLLAGLLVPTLMYTFKDKKESAVAVLGLDYALADEGKAPDGTALDISYLKSSYIVQNALGSVTLSRQVSTAQVQANLQIAGVLTDETKQKMDIINKLEEVKNNDYAKILQDFKLQYRSQYIISIKNGFTDADGKDRFNLPTNDLSHLLTAITDAYANYFIETYQDKVTPSNYLEAINVETLDYLDILDEVDNSLKYLQEYCEQRANFLPGFRAKDGKTFGELASMISNSRGVQVDYYTAYIYLNNVYKDPDMALTNYKIQKRDAELALNETIANINTTQNSIDNYKPDKVVINSTDGSTPITVDVTSDTYNALILKLKDLNAQKSSLEERIAKLTDRISRLEGTPANDEQKAKAKSMVDEALARAKEYYEHVNENAKELFSSNAYTSKYMHAITTYESERFSDNLKLFAIGAAAGLFLGLIIWIGDAFVLEFKAVKRANDLREAEQYEK